MVTVGYESEDNVLNNISTNNGNNSNSQVVDMLSDIPDVNNELSITTSTQGILMNASVPICYPEWHTSPKSEAELVNQLRTTDFITAELSDELIAHYPIIDDMLPNKIMNSVTKSKSKFTEHILKLFPKTRMFLNYKQLDQYVTTLLQAWSIRKQRHGFTFL